MARINVKQTIDIQEVDDEEVGAMGDLSLEVNSHWNWHDNVILVIEGKSYTVVGHDLKTAIDNAMNTS